VLLSRTDHVPSNVPAALRQLVSKCLECRQAQGVAFGGTCDLSEALNIGLTLRMRG